jgi:hypothetical protein
MLENTFLSLSGHGYLHDIQHRQHGEWFVTLNLLHQFNNSQSDDVWLECRFDRDKFPLFSKLKQDLEKKKSILLKFDASYSGFQQCYTEQPENGPRFIVQLYGELLNVHGYYLESANIFYRNKHDRENNRVRVA